jgi:hypothetical protein
MGDNGFNGVPRDKLGLLTTPAQEEKMKSKPDSKLVVMRGPTMKFAGGRQSEHASRSMRAAWLGLPIEGKDSRTYVVFLFPLTPFVFT